ncbi:MAG: Co2+/Mg2+ efflux protein ApaG [Flavobacteriales bacterium]|nr:Co2+/Mg2+ efflux protein ApaG [Flavobacteriales bacterium]
MNTLTTSGVQISVRTDFRSDLSEITKSSYFHNYQVQIQNTNSFPIQLKTRDWYIFDSLNEDRYVRGAGVVGEYPILKPGESFQYTSGCDLRSEIGYMKGFYTFINLLDGNLFEAVVPDFRLEYPAKLN